MLDDEQKKKKSGNESPDASGRPSTGPKNQVKEIKES